MSLALLLIAVALVAMLATIFLVCWWAVPRLERFYLFRPGREVYQTPTDVGIPFEQLFIETPDGCCLSAWHLLPAKPIASVVYFHGSAWNLGIVNEILSLFYGSGLQVLAIDYRGFGWSTGTPSEKGMYVDSLATVRYFREHLNQPGLPLIYWGRSLGSCAAAFAANQIPPTGLILESAFPSKAALLTHYPQFRLFYPFSRCRLNTLRYLKRHRFPVLLLHGDRDRTIPLAQGQLLFEKLTGPKEFYCIAGGDHINLHRLNSAAYMKRVLEFVETLKNCGAGSLAVPTASGNPPKLRRDQKRHPYL